LQNTIFRDEYDQERFRIHVDHLNLLYVAFTRARDSLFVMTPYEPMRDESLRNVSNLLGLLLTKDNAGGGMQEHFNSASLKWSVGEPEQFLMKEKKFPATTYIDHSVSNVRSRAGLRIHWHGKDFFDPAAEEKINYGKLMHEILQHMNSREELDRALDKLMREGKLDRSELEPVRQEMMDFMDLQPVDDWFSGKWEVLNERDILMSDGHVRRPDRVMIMDQHIVVIDYKFGSSRLREHQEQIIEYMKLIRDMGYNDVQGYICYVRQKQIIPVSA
jgi:ATP-dependent exoDNAse (exonuclease V) beta subunit